MPRNNDTSNTSAPRSRTRGPARSPAPPTASVDAADDRSPSTATTSSSARTEAVPTFDEIAEAAYHRYLRRGAREGQDFDDWVEAERELKARRSN